MHLSIPLCSLKLSKTDLQKLANKTLQTNLYCVIKTFINKRYIYVNLKLIKEKTMFFTKQKNIKKQKQKQFKKTKTKKKKNTQVLMCRIHSDKSNSM